MSKSVFETLQELETDELWSPEIEHGDLDLRIEATLYLKRAAIDVMIREKLSGMYVLENMRCNSSQDMPPLPFNCKEEFEWWKKIPRLTYYTFRYDIAKDKPSDEVPDLHVGQSSWIPPNFDADNLRLLNDSKSQESCPDCKDGFYYPFVGPKEPCQTYQDTAISKSSYTDGTFKSSLSAKLKNINLSPMSFSVGPIPPHDIFSVEFLVRDGEKSKTVDYFYSGIEAELRNTFSGREIHLDFSGLTIDMSYDANTSGVRVVVKFNIKVI